MKYPIVKQKELIQLPLTQMSLLWVELAVEVSNRGADGTTGGCW